MSYRSYVRIQFYSSFTFPHFWLPSSSFFVGLWSFTLLWVINIWDVPSEKYVNTYFANSDSSWLSDNLAIGKQTEGVASQISFERFIFIRISWTANTSSRNDSPSWRAAWRLLASFPSVSLWRMSLRHTTSMLYLIIYRQSVQLMPLIFLRVCNLIRIKSAAVVEIKRQMATTGVFQQCKIDRRYVWFGVEERTSVRWMSAWDFRRIIISYSFMLSNRERCKQSSWSDDPAAPPIFNALYLMIEATILIRIKMSYFTSGAIDT